MMQRLVRASLGTTGLSLSRVGFGSWALGGADWVSSWGPQGDDESIAAIRHAVEAGVNWIDTAAVYGLGHSEEVVAKALAGIPDADRPLVLTKGGLIWDEANRRQGSAKVAEPSSLRREVEASLRRLDTEAIDVYFIHWPAEDGTPLEVYWQTLNDLKAEGKLRAIGLSNHDLPQLVRAEAVGHIDVVQPPFSAIDPGAAADLLPWCADNGTGVVVYSPMGSGLLTGRFSAERVAALPEDDWRRRHRAFTTDLEKNLAIAAAMERVAARYDVPTRAVAVAWTLGFPGVTAAIVGARNPGQVDGWVPAAGLRLTADDYTAISAGLSPAITD